MPSKSSMPFTVAIRTEPQRCRHARALLPVEHDEAARVRLRPVAAPLQVVGGGQSRLPGPDDDDVGRALAARPATGARRIGEQGAGHTSGNTAGARILPDDGGT